MGIWGVSQQMEGLSFSVTHFQINSYIFTEKRKGQNTEPVPQELSPLVFLAASTLPPPRNRMAFTGGLVSWQARCAEWVPTVLPGTG